MPPDHQSAAAALANPASPGATSPLSSSPQPSRSPSPDPPIIPPWARPRTSSSAHRLSTRPYSLHRTSTSTSPSALFTNAIRTATSLTYRAQTLFLSLSPLYRALVVLFGLVVAGLGITALVFSHAIFAALGPIAQTWRDLPYNIGVLLVFLPIFGTAFPPVIGYSSAVTLAGFVYGFPGGWPIAAVATVAGSTASFLASRGVCGGYVHKLVGKDKRFVALGQVLRRDGIAVLTMIRFCPLPYSLSNGFLATIPSVGVGSFALGTALSTPKLLVHVFIGSRLAKLAEEGDTMPAGVKAINYAGMLFGGIVGTVVGLLVYRRTMARAAELEAEAIASATNGGVHGEDGAAGGEYDDSEESLLMRSGADPDAAALMDDDDISLWEAEGNGAYRDSWDEEAALGEQGRKL